MMEGRAGKKRVVRLEGQHTLVGAFFLSYVMYFVRSILFAFGAPFGVDPDDGYSGLEGSP